ncbi:MAG TPA: CsbD family protein [Pyrinomonadaceae bacterium]|nr:CsbD family protein [Pyrinomonadaceae bacterium]
MAIVNKDEIKGKLNQAKGKIKDKAGELTGNRRMEVEGESEIARGQTQETWGETKRKVSNAVKDVADKINN